MASDFRGCDGDAVPGKLPLPLANHRRLLLTPAPDRQAQSEAQQVLWGKPVPPHCRCWLWDMFLSVSSEQRRAPVLQPFLQLSHKSASQPVVTTSGLADHGNDEFWFNTEEVRGIHPLSQPEVVSCVIMTLNLSPESGPAVLAETPTPDPHLR